MDKPSSKDINYTQVFSSPAGKQVLEDLCKRYKETTGLPEGDVKASLAFDKGQRTVINYILQSIERGKGDK